MQIFPAIDLKDQQVVRLTQGDFNQATVYAHDPVEVARDFIDLGAKNLHVIDLDGAREGKTTNMAKIKEIVALGGLFVQVGGGIRDERSVDAYLELGVGRVILGTVAVENFAFLERMVKKHGERICVSVDARDGKVSVRGWLQDSALDAVEFCSKLDGAGVKTIVFTDISRDGLLEGANHELYKTLNDKLTCDIIAAGGVSSMADIKALTEMGLHGAIIGKALYEGKLQLADALEG